MAIALVYEDLADAVEAGDSRQTLTLVPPIREATVRLPTGAMTYQAISASFLLGDAALLARDPRGAGTTRRMPAPDQLAKALRNRAKLIKRSCEELSSASPGKDRLITSSEAAENFGHSESWWRARVGDDKPISLRGIGDKRAKLMSYAEAERYAKRQKLAKA